MQDLKVIYEDNHIIVVEKRPNIPSQADKTGDIDMLTIIKQYIKEKYARENAELVVLDYENISNLNINVIEADLIKITKRYVKHNAEKLAELIMKNI